MNIIDIINKKKIGVELTKEEIYFFVNSYSNGKIADYQASSLLMAIVLKGMNSAEVSHLTMAMVESGEQLNLSSIDGVVADKHSTGGVGDKTTLVLAPLLAACGIKVAKMSGRGLGHTGGTIDKLESILGFNTSLAIESFIKQVNTIGVAVIGQTLELVPADKKLYALRDVTGTVDSIPLIASSIMSKKIAAGAYIICLDVKYGSGAFLKTLAEARALAEAMVNIGERLGRKVNAVLSSMQQPLGHNIGNTLEVIEAIETLSGKGPDDLLEVCLKIGECILLQAGLAETEALARKMLLNKIANGEALEKFRQLVSSQGGDVSYIDDVTKFNKCSHIAEVKANNNGYIFDIDALAVGIISMHLGAGRLVKEDNIDMAAGIVLTKKVGSKVNKGDVIALIHTNKKDYHPYIDELKQAIKISTNKPNVAKLIEEVI